MTTDENKATLTWRTLSGQWLRVAWAHTVKVHISDLPEGDGVTPTVQTSELIIIMPHAVLLSALFIKVIEFKNMVKGSSI